MSKKITTGVEKAYYAILTADGETPTYAQLNIYLGLEKYQ